VDPREVRHSKEMMGQAASKGLFSEERPKPGTGEEIAAETAALEKRRAEKERRERAAEPSYLPVERKAEEGGEGDAHTSTPSSASAEPRLSLEETTTLLTELRDLYKRRVHVQLYRLEASRRAAHRQTRRRGKERKSSNALPDGFAAFVDDIELEDFMYLIHRSAGKVKIYDPEQVDTAMRVPEWTPLPDTFDIPIGLPAAVIVNMQREMSRNGGRPVQIQSKRTRGDAVSAIEAAHPPPPPPPEWTGP